SMLITILWMINPVINSHQIAASGSFLIGNTAPCSGSHLIGQGFANPGVNRFGTLFLPGPLRHTQLAFQRTVKTTFNLFPVGCRCRGFQPEVDTD
ncbi:hypothetical protein, partial [Rhodoferax sp.]|uniref:hypothetical protein n=1 Tax=Rhodoferax sp. TaxID=50421 RepID=UPI0026332683